MTTQSINLKKIQKHLCFLSDGDIEDTWGTFVTTEDIRRCIDENRLESIPYSVAQEMGDINYSHAERIAYLVLNKDDTPIDIDVGVPSAGCVVQFGHYIVDGNHRCVAAIFRGDKTIYAEISGELDYVRKLFGKKVADAC